MENKALIRMANQIASFFIPYTEEEGIQGVADHMTSFWEPRMRKQILALSEGEQRSLDPLVQRALSRLKSTG